MADPGMLFNMLVSFYFRTAFYLCYATSLHILEYIGFTQAVFVHINAGPVASNVT